MKKENYKDWTFVSLGCDCEVDFRFRHFNKHISSYLYSYTAVLDPFTFIQFFSSPEIGVFSSFCPYKDGMLRERVSNIAFHSKSQTGWPMLMTAFDEKSFISRLNHLWKKTQVLCSSANSKILFVQKIPYGWMSYSYFESLLNGLDKCVAGQFHLLIIVERRYAKECARYLPHDRRVSMERVRFFDVPSHRGDLWGWLRICKKYANGNSLRYLCSASPLLRTILLPLVMWAKHPK